MENLQLGNFRVVKGLYGFPVKYIYVFPLLEILLQAVLVIRALDNNFVNFFDDASATSYQIFERGHFSEIHN